MGIKIHVIKRNGKDEFRCGNDTSSSYFLSEVEQPYDSLDAAAEHMAEWQVENDGTEGMPKDTLARDWKGTLANVLKTRKINENCGWSRYFDLDDFVDLLDIVTVKGKDHFGVSDEEAEVFRQVGEYLRKERELPGAQPSKNFDYDTFCATVDRVTEKMMSTDLNSGLVAISRLNSIKRYIENVQRTYTDN